MSNQVLSVVAYESSVMGDLSSNPKFQGFAHIQSNLDVWGQKESGVRFPLVAIEGIAPVSDGYVILVGMHLGELFGIHEQDDNGEIKARHARGAVYIPAEKLGAATKSSLDELLRTSAEWLSTPVTVTDRGVKALLEASGSELRKWVIIDKNGVDTGARFPAISFGREKAIAVISCEEVVLEQAISGFATSWQITSFMASGDFRFRLPGAGGSSSVSAIAAHTGFDINEFVGRDVDKISDAAVVPIQPIAPAPAAQPQAVAPVAQSRFIRK